MLQNSIRTMDKTESKQGKLQGSTFTTRTTLDMIGFGLKMNRFLIFLTFFIYACNNNPVIKNQEIGYICYFRNGDDALSVGKREDVALKVINSHFDSLSLLLGTLEEHNLVLIRKNLLSVPCLYQ